MTCVDRTGGEEETKVPEFNMRPEQQMSGHVARGKLNPEIHTHQMPAEKDITSSPNADRQTATAPIHASC